FGRVTIILSLTTSIGLVVVSWFTTESVIKESTWASDTGASSLLQPFPKKNHKRSRIIGSRIHQRPAPFLRSSSAGGSAAGVSSRRSLEVGTNGVSYRKYLAVSIM